MLRAPVVSIGGGQLVRVYSGRSGAAATPTCCNVKRLMGGGRMETQPGVLVQNINHVTGKSEWKMMPEDYDYNQELARAAFADMLHDTERNDLYRRGLVAAIQLLKSRGEEVHVLDIGTGTGLLSMMAAVEGVDSITACEEFRPMAECASRVIADNGFQDKIKLVRKRSTELRVGPGCDMERRANVLVTEVFDTELIGEGAIGTYNHANKHLLTQDRIVVPGHARIFVQAVSSSQCSAWSRLQPVVLEGEKEPLLQVSGTETISNLVLHDIQLSELDETLFTPLTPPVEVFSFDLACREGDIPANQQTCVAAPAIASGSCDGVFMWWDCWTDPECNILLSCAPKWAHHSPKRLPWRDHWMQAIYYPKSITKAEKGKDLTIISNHDEYSLWFDVKTDTSLNPPEATCLPISRLRLGELNSHHSNAQHAAAVRYWLKQRPSATFLVVSDQSRLGLLAAALGAKKVIICEPNRHMRSSLHCIAQLNCLTDRVTIISDLEELEPGSVDVVLDEPHHSVTLLPWHNLLLWYTTRRLQERGILNTGEDGVPCLSPSRCSLWLLPVHYRDLWKIRAPLGVIQGFSLAHFDRIIEEASSEADAVVEPHPLWEYPCTALSTPTLVGSFSLVEALPEQEISFTGDISLSYTDKELNGLAMWTTWDLAPGVEISSGPVRPVEPGDTVAWGLHSKQGVHLCQSRTLPATGISYNIVFQPEEGDFRWHFDMLTS